MSKKKKKDWKKELIVLVISLALMFLITNYGQEIEAYANNYLNISIFDFSENEVAQSDNLVIETIPLSFDLDSIPEYTNSSYVIINDNKPNFDENDYTTTAFETYSELDSLGRCGVAFANVCKETQPKKNEKRGEISSIKPSGWNQKVYQDLIKDGSVLYNRSHLIGWQLTAENANEKNLITGTRYFNAVGMLEFENIVDNYLEQKGKKNNHVLYRVTPVFEGANLVASGVQMEAYSVEDGGEGVCFNVYVYNVQPGIEINYANGDSHAK